MARGLTKDALAARELVDMLAAVVPLGEFDLRVIRARRAAYNIECGRKVGKPARARGLAKRCVKQCAGLALAAVVAAVSVPADAHARDQKAFEAKMCAAERQHIPGFAGTLVVVKHRAKFDENSMPVDDPRSFECPGSAGVEPMTVHIWPGHH